MISHFISLVNNTKCPHCGSKSKELIKQNEGLVVLPLVWDEDGHLVSDKSEDPVVTTYYCLSCQKDYEVVES